MRNDNRRIAVNTGILYVRMLLIMAITIYTSRILLKALGITDYGIYNVVGSAVTLFSFLNSCLIPAWATRTKRSPTTTPAAPLC